MFRGHAANSLPFILCRTHILGTCLCVLLILQTQSFYLFELQPETIVVRPLKLQFGNLNSYEVADIPIL